MNLNSEDATTEKPALELLENLGWDVFDAFAENDGTLPELSGRERLDEVVLVKYLRPALEKLNPNAPREAIDATVTELQRDRSTMTPVAANQEIYKLLKDGYKTNITDDDDEPITVYIVDMLNPSNNTYTAISQFWILGRLHKRRPDILGFVNGLPLIHIELKAPDKKARDAYTDNLRDYRDTIPQLFWYNQFIMISNGTDTRVGSITAPLEHFAEWKRINDEGEVGVISLDTTIRATCEPVRAMDIIENFILFTVGDDGKVAKLVTKNHQYIGVNNAVQSLRNGDDGRLGVFWHTQGSGKSYSMVFFAQKVMRKVPGNWTFVVVTDRLDLDSQIYKNFARAGAVTEIEEQVRAESSSDLQTKLRQDHRYLFTLIHKFQAPDKTIEMPLVSDRNDIIVMTDEAHRTQYATLALNMRNALPNARFIGFTGTPLIAGASEKTKEVFGDYVSKYNFKEAVDDGATVPLYYENRIPELQLTNEDFDEDMEKIIEAAELDEEQGKLLERQFARQYHLVTREDRLETISKDIVEHFLNRGYQGKAMVVSIDKVTAVRTYDKVCKYWQLAMDSITTRLEANPEPELRERLEEQLAYMKSTDMAVIISQSQNEIDDFRKKGLDIVPHRERMIHEDLEEAFKAPSNPLRLVFVCAMWITGFDAQSISTVYLDKPMRGHTLMQTIARANRVFAGKTNGLIVDYIGVFRDLQKALSIYGEGAGGDMPVRDKHELLADLDLVLAEIKSFVSSHGQSLDSVEALTGFERVGAIARLVNSIVATPETKKEFGSLAGSFDKIFKAILPDPQGNKYLPTYQLLRTIQGQIQQLKGETTIDHVTKDIEELLDESIEAGSYTINELKADEVIDLSQVDFGKLQAKFGLEPKNIETEKLKNEVDARLKHLLELNKTRVDLAEKFQHLIDEYNAGSKNIEEFFNELVEFAHELDEEEQRAVREEMSEEELVIFDLILRPGPELNQTEVKQVKKAARDLLLNLKQQKLVLDWKKSQQNRAIVQRTIRDVLNDELPSGYNSDWQRKKLGVLYEHFYESYEDANTNIYELAG